MTSTQADTIRNYEQQKPQLTEGGMKTDKQQLIAVLYYKFL